MTMTNTTDTAMHHAATTSGSTKVLVIGNGPAGLSASAILAGWRPYYGRYPHPSRHIHNNLSPQSHVSLIDQDLSWWTDEGGLSKLLDVLVRPDADIGHNHPTTIRWEFEPDKAVEHVVMAQTQPGGSWHEYSQQLMSVSSNTWFDLPAVSMTEWLGGQPLLDRLPVAIVKSYFEAYPKSAHIQQYQMPGCTVHSVERVGDEWKIEYTTNDSQQQETLHAEKVILATGVTQPRRLEVPGEDDAECVVHSVPAMERLFELDTSVNQVLTAFQEVHRFMHDQHTNEHPPATLCDARVSEERELGGNCCAQINGGTVVVVGSGLSAADAVFSCLVHKIRVVHVFRKHPRQIKNSLLGKLTSTRYLDYRSIVALMNGKDKCELYEPVSQHEVVDIDTQNEQVTIRHVLRNHEVKLIKAQSVVVLIGSRVTMPFYAAAAQILNDNHQKVLYDAHTNQVWDRTTNKSVDGLFAAGPLVGNSFVRYIVGGSVLTAKSVLSEVSRVSS